MKPYWQHFSHEADIGVRGVGDSMEEAFEQAAVALCAVVTEPESVTPTTEVRVNAEAPDPEILLVDWLNGIIYEMAVRRMLFSHCDVNINGNRLHGTARGESVEKLRHQPAVEIKGATFTALRVKQQEDGSWVAQCIVDV